MFTVIHSALRWCSFGFVCFCIIRCNISERLQINNPLNDRFTILENGKLLGSCKTPSFGPDLEDLFLLISQIRVQFGRGCCLDDMTLPSEVGLGSSPRSELFS